MNLHRLPVSAFWISAGTWVERLTIYYYIIGMSKYMWCVPRSASRSKVELFGGMLHWARIKLFSLCVYRPHTYVYSSIANSLSEKYNLFKLYTYHSCWWMHYCTVHYRTKTDQVCARFIASRRRVYLIFKLISTHNIVLGEIDCICYMCSAYICLEEKWFE